MRFAVAHDAVSYLFAGLGLLALHLGGGFSPLFASALAAGVVATLFVRPERAFSRRHGALVTAAVAALFVAQAIRALFFEPFFSMAVEFAALLQVSRLAHRRTAADYKQIAGLSLLHLIGATILTRDLGYAALFAGYVVATPWMFGLTQVREALERRYRDPARDEHEPDPDVTGVLARRDVVGPGFFVGTAALSLALVVVTTTVFLAFPRVTGDFLGLRGGAADAVTGFGEDVSLGGFGTIRTDRRVVLRLFPEEGAAEGAGPPFVLRGTSFDRYEDGRWSRSETPARRRSLARAPLTLGEGGGGSVRYTIVSEIAPEPVLVLPEGTTRLERADAGSGARVDEVEHRPGVDVRALDGDASVRRFAVTVAPKSVSREAPRRERYLALPPEMDRLAELARAVVGAERRPRAMAEAIERHLRDGPYRYTLEQVSVEGMDPIEHFLFERRAGHCEYFSTAMALMLRSVGVPARNVTGFVGGHLNEYGGYYAVRQGDAHSWVEALVDGRFVRFDPTPAARASFGVDDDLLTRLQSFVDSLRVAWYERVVGYDFRDQRALFRALGALTRGGRSAGKSDDAMAPEAIDLSALGSPWTLAAWAGAAAGLLAALGVLRARRKRRTEPPEEVKLLVDLERAAARRGAERLAHETPLEWAARLTASRVPVAPAVARGVRAFGALRYENVTDRRGPLAALREAADSIKRGAGRGSTPRPPPPRR